MPTYSETTESRWFKIVVVIASGLATAFFITNAVFYDKIRQSSCTAISKDEADVMFYLNVIFAIITGIIFIWGIFRLFTRKDYRVSLQERSTAYITTTGQRAKQAVITAGRGAGQYVTSTGKKVKTYLTSTEGGYYFGTPPGTETSPGTVVIESE